MIKLVEALENFPFVFFSVFYNFHIIETQKWIQIYLNKYAKHVFTAVKQDDTYKIS